MIKMCQKPCFALVLPPCLIATGLILISIVFTVKVVSNNGGGQPFAAFSHYYHHHHHKSANARPVAFGPFFGAAASEDTGDDYYYPEPVVRTNYGAIRGLTRRIRGNTPEQHHQQEAQFMDIFYGVPFAQPPVGELRFEKPAMLHKWGRSASEQSKGASDQWESKEAKEEILTVQKPPAKCIPHARPPAKRGGFWGLTTSRESEEEYSEDCLYLNIMSPHKEQPPERNSTTLLHPVLFIVHGGGYSIGSSHRYSDHREIGTKYVAEGIVVVATNYRLGALGFASAGDRAFPGNYGLWDQAAALRWVRENIRYFGGDPKRITLFGHSSGAASVAALGLSPTSRDNFHQAVQMSGSIFAAWSTSERVVSETLCLARAMRCDDEQFVSNGSATAVDASDMKHCLRDKSVEDLYRAVDECGSTRDGDMNFVKFGPRLDGVFFPRDYPELVMESLPRPTIMGFTEVDSLLFATVLPTNTSITHFTIPNNERDSYGAEQLQAFIREVVVKDEYYGPTKASKIRKAVEDFYLLNTSTHAAAAVNSTFYLARYAQLLSDLQFVVPAIWEGRLRSQLQWPLFLYEHSYVDQKAFPPGYIGPRAAFHCADHDLLFRPVDGAPQGDDLSSMDRVVERMYVRALVSFVKRGTPSMREVPWPRADRNNPTHYISIEAPGRYPIKNMFGFERLKFWLTLLEKYPQYNLIRGMYHEEFLRDEL